MEGFPLHIITLYRVYKPRRKHTRLTLQTKSAPLAARRISARDDREQAVSHPRSELPRPRLMPDCDARRAGIEWHGFKIKFGSHASRVEKQSLSSVSHCPAAQFWWTFRPAPDKHLLPGG
jgi:hypothetical protein